MASWERQTQKPRRRTPSFSSSLLEAIYHSTDDSQTTTMADFILDRRNNAAKIDDEIENLRRSILMEKWMENYTPRHLPSNSASSTDSSIFSSSETESSASKSSHKPKHIRTHLKDTIFPIETSPKREGRFTRTKSRALKIYGDLKKVKEPISPGRRIANFLNSIFSPINAKKNQTLEEWSSVTKSKSMKDTNICSLASKSCLSRNPTSSMCKSKRSVRFCPVSVIVDEQSRACGQRTVYDYGSAINSSMVTMGSQFIKKNIDSFGIYEENESDLDDMSYASSDLFELENIGIGSYDEELPVYGTTSLKLNHAIASGFVV